MMGSFSLEKTTLEIMPRIVQGMDAGGWWGRQAIFRCMILVMVVDGEDYGDVRAEEQMLGTI